MRTVGLVSIWIFLPAGIFAQDVSKVEVFGGYQYLRNPPGAGNAGINLNGWNAAISGNVTGWLSGVAEVSGNYGSKSIPALTGPPFSFKEKVHTFLFGPRLLHRRDRFTLFGQALVGWLRDDIKVTSPTVVRSDLHSKLCT